MFDQIHRHQHHTTQEVAKETIVHNSITPDKVTDMYNKIEKEVRDNFIRKYVIGDNNMQGVVVQSYKDYLHDIEDIVARFTLNGKEYIFRREGHRFEKIKTDEEMFEIFAEYFKLCVVKEILKPIAESIFKRKSR